MDVYICMCFNNDDVEYCMINNFYWNEINENNYRIIHQSAIV